MKLSLKKALTLTLLCLIIVSLVSAFLLLNRTASPLSEAEKKKVLQKLSGAQAGLVQRVALKGYKTYNGKFYSFSYPAAGLKYDPKNSQNQDILEEFSFQIKDFPKVYFYSEVKTAQWYLKTIADYSGISFRLSNPTVYTKKTISINGQSGLVFIKSNLSDSEVFEKTAYFLVNKKIYSFTCQSADEQVNEEIFNRLLASVKFLN
jgi:hypothetical protein